MKRRNFLKGMGLVPLAATPIIVAATPKEYPESLLELKEWIEKRHKVGPGMSNQHPSRAVTHEPYITFWNGIKKSERDINIAHQTKNLQQALAATWLGFQGYSQIAGPAAILYWRSTPRYDAPGIRMRMLLSDTKPDTTPFSDFYTPGKPDAKLFSD